MIRTLVICLLAISISALSQAQVNEKFNINQMRSQGELTATYSPFDIGAFYDIFDGNVTTLARCHSSNNPMVVTLVFSGEVGLTSSRVNSATPGQWTIEIADNLVELNSHGESYTRLFGPADINGNQFYSRSFAANTKATVVRLTLLRTNSDFYPHLREWELYGTYAPMPVSISLDPVNEHISPAQTIQYQARGERSDGSLYAISATALTWTSVDTNVAEINTSGLATGKSSGRTLIRATYTRGENSVSGATYLYVNPEGIICK